MRIVVIGSGFGGLAAAIRLRALGHTVTVLERRARPGGRAAALDRDGFRFDAGPTIITAPQMIDELFALSGRRREDYVALRRIDPFYRVHFDDGSAFACSGDEGAMEGEVARFSPGDVAGYRRFAATAKRIFERAMPLIDVPVHSVASMATFLPALVSTRAWRSVASLASRSFRDERLQRVFSFHPLLIGGNPFTAPALYALIPELEKRWGVWYAMGGTFALVEALVALLVESDVEVLFDTAASAIEIDRASGRAIGVRSEDGRRFAADVVVSNADPSSTYRDLLGSWRGDDGGHRFTRYRYGMSVFVLYLGLDRVYDELWHHEIVMGTRYRELLDDVFRRRVLTDDFSLYLHHPTVTDRSVAPAGGDALYALVPVPNLASGTDWSVAGDGLRTRIVDLLERRFLPDLARHIRTEIRIDPRHFRDELRTPHGAAFSIEPLLSQSAWFRPHNQSEHVPNLFLVGAGTHPGAGIPGVLSSARIAANLIGPSESRSSRHARETLDPATTASR